MNAAAIKTEVEERGLRWEAVREAYLELRERERLQREWKWTIRGEAWYRTGYGHGGRFKWAYRKAFNGGDHDGIPGFDVLAQSMASAYPELAGDDNATQRLWELLCEPVDRMPPAEETYRQAIELLLDGYYVSDDTSASFPDDF